MLGLGLGIQSRLHVLNFKLRNMDKKKYECPVCDYVGPFEDYNPPDGLRKHAKCPKCSALERHRIQWVVTISVLRERDTSGLKMMHFAPEACFRALFSRRFGKYETADLNRKDVDHNVDLQVLPFADASYDFVFASHVLEHIPNDKKAISEIRRILRPGGIAILPVPVVEHTTVEYPEPNPYEFGHVRAPGIDYFDRYEPFFSRVLRYRSDSLPEKHQLFIYESRAHFPTKEYPLRNSMPGNKFNDVVPVCYV